MQLHQEYSYTGVYFAKQNWNQINNTQLTDEELEILGSEQPRELDNSYSNLPVAYKQVGEYEQNKPTIVISYTEDQSDLIQGFCKYLDRYIANLPDETKNKYNILVAVSTSAEDMLRALKKAKEIIGEKFSQAKFLFLNDMGINHRKNGQLRTSAFGGKNIIKIAKDFIGENALIRTLIQTLGDCDKDHKEISLPTEYWCKNQEKYTNEIFQNFLNNKISSTDKLAESQDGVYVPIDAFLKFLHEREESSEN